MSELSLTGGEQLVVGTGWDAVGWPRAGAGVVVAETQGVVAAHGRQRPSLGDRGMELRQERGQH